MPVLAPILPLLALLLLDPLPSDAAAAAVRRPDFIIVGAGTSGCALAARLCKALPRAHVTVLERGPPRTPEEDVQVSAPRLLFQLPPNPRIAETSFTEPEPGLFNRRLDILGGSTLGGTSAINGGQWNVPPRGIVPAWRIRGLTEKRAAALYEQARVRLSVATPPEDLRHSLYQQWTDAAAAASLPELDDPFGTSRRKNGVYYNRVAVDEAARRQDSYTAYLAPELEGACKGRVQVIQGATVTKLLVAGKRRRPFGRLCKSSAAKKSCRCRFRPSLKSARFVRGLQYVLGSDKNTTIKLRARAEVLVSAGPLGSPKLLQLSGIGPSKLLRSLGIKRRANLPVGRRAQGKPLSPLLNIYSGAPLGLENDIPKILSPEALEQWTRGDGGPLGISVASMNGFFGQSLLEMVQTTFVEAVFGKPNILSLCLLNPKSFGTIEVAGKDPFRPPKAKLNFLSQQEEVDELVRCTQKLREVNAKLDPSIVTTELAPGVPEINETVVRGSAINAYHLVGGCAVGSVLDPDLRVNGFDNLRVIDTSSIPSLPSFAGPMSSAYMLAEHAARLIGKQYKCTKLGRP